MMRLLPEDWPKWGKQSPIRNPSQVCYERLAVHCCEYPNRGTIFYNVDRIENYVNELASPVALSTVNFLSKTLDRDFMHSWVKKQGPRGILFRIIKGAVRVMTTISIVLHERLHWADRCNVNVDVCDGEARTTAYSIKITIDFVKGKRLED
ncbi:MAG: hypothetical protein MPF33_10905 [Candidatus Aramenus sp.]|jgi:hypothetical protein|nr:hypothetical protein [Candidatus Aramenus sp.]